MGLERTAQDIISMLPNPPINRPLPTKKCPHTPTKPSRTNGSRIYSPDHYLARQVLNGKAIPIRSLIYFP